MLILKTLWARRRRNGWLLAELILVCVLSWVIFDPVLVLTYERNLPLGYDADRLCVVKLDFLKPKAPGYDPQGNDSASVSDAFYNLLVRVRQHPDVERATLLPEFCYINSMGNSTNAFRAEGDTVREDLGFNLFSYFPHTDFFETYGLQPGEGQTAESLSDYAGEGVIITENALQHLYGSTANPAGRRRMWQYYRSDTTRTEVAGSVCDFKNYSHMRPIPALFQPQKGVVSFFGSYDLSLLVRVRKGMGLERFVHDFRPWMQENLRAGNLYAGNLTTYPDLMKQQATVTEFKVYRRNLMMAVFFLINLCLGVVGTFWLQTRTRREEVGVMLSFGATPGRIVRQLLGEGVVLTLLATLVGCFLYLQYALSEGLFVNTTRFALPCWVDSFWQHFVLVSLFVWAVLMVVVSIGVYIPASKISRIPPTEALRDE